MLPVPVLEEAARDMLNYKGSGMSVMEMSHRSKVYEEIIKDAEAALRRLMSIPENYKVLFLQGGASTQFAAVPLNLLSKDGKADYIVSGQFSKKAYEEAQKYGDVQIAASSSATSPPSPPLIFVPTQTTSTSATTTPSSAPSIPRSPTRAPFLWLPICPPASSPSPSTFPASA